jgi:hypothetical protein
MHPLNDAYHIKLVYPHTGILFFNKSGKKYSYNILTWKSLKNMQSK